MIRVGVFWCELMESELIESEMLLCKLTEMSC
jgi:hypothetical protein